MPDKIHIPYGIVDEESIYLRFRDAAGQYRRGDTGLYEPWDADHIALYGADAGSTTPYHVATEDGSSGDYFADLPDAVARGWSAYLQAGASPSAAGDVDIEIVAGQIGIDPTAATQIQAATAAALAAYDPPTYAEMNSGFGLLDWVSRAILFGTVDTVTSNADFTLAGDLGAVNDLYKYCWLVFTDGPNKGTGRMIQIYTGATKRVQFTGAGSRGAFATTVTAGDAFYIVPTTDLVAGIIGVVAN